MSELLVYLNGRRRCKVYCDARTLARTTVRACLQQPCQVVVLAKVRVGGVVKLRTASCCLCH